MAYEKLAEILANLVVELKEVKARLHKLESSPTLPAKPAAPSSLAHTSSVGSYPRKGQLAAPTSTPTKGSSTTALPGINSLSSKAAFEKTVITLSIPDEQVGHVVGKSGAGLRQIHEVSKAKISVAPPSDTSGLRSVTIRGSAREVGDAISAIGKCLAHRRIRKSREKKQKKAEDSSQPHVVLHVQSSPIPISSPPVRTPSIKITPPVKTPDKTPSPVSVVHVPKSVASKAPTPMSITSPTPGTQPRTSSPGSPMEIDSVGQEYSYPGPVKPRPGLQTARRARPYFRGSCRSLGQ
ncbi:hypothetical protein M422DRAFT_263482 [Sphaerobolus stellatus SS14]|uniref:K Homology domain-containing protein n=1 Tax=Sphaerobolus stellatus (strain SS14) TaxID=990650 RepID=A0A0C9UZ15_SPHS4|nr:hypothetical protein M422DRAFT_263482 [Sphaerobolus stellatus SS14]